MSTKLGSSILVILVALASAACEVNKSANPLSPVVAGPIAGVTISTPNGLSPGQDTQIFMRDQPVKLLFQNAASTGQRTVTYTVEVATDANFNSIAFKRTGIAPDSGSTTTFQLPDTLATGRTYWWRVRAEDGANASDYSKAMTFVAVQPVILAMPTATRPGGLVDTLTPDFRVLSGPDSGPTTHLVITIQVADDPSFAFIVLNFTGDATGNETLLSPGSQLRDSHTYYWRGQVKDTGPSQAVSPWSGVQVFTTPVPVAPPSSGGGGGGGVVVGGSWKNCGSTPGYTLVDCVRNAVNPSGNGDLAFEVTKRVAWLLRGSGAGLLIKNGGENTTLWMGYSFSISRIAYPNGGIVKVVSDAGPGGSNGAAWDESLNYPGSVDPALYVPAINPD